DDGVAVRDVEIGKDGAAHVVHYDRDGRREQATTRWLIDAASRASPVKRKLGLAKSNAHDANAIWFRIGTKIDMDEWSDDQAWRTCCRTSASCATSRMAASRCSPATAGRSPARRACSSTRSTRPARTSSASRTPTSPR